MARNTPLSTVIDMVLDESRLSSNASRGPDNRAYVRQLIKRHQIALYDEYHWPFMELKHADGDVSLVAGTRYYDFPNKLDLEGVVDLWHPFGSVWIPVIRGITLADYSAFNSDDDQRADPPLKWDNYDETQFEIWPIPKSAGSVRFTGRKKLNDLIDEDDTLDLDDVMVSLFAAADVLAAKKQADAQTKLDAANRRVTQVRANLYKDIETRVGLGDKQDGPQTKTGWPRTIAVWNDT